ncbi:MAG: TIGR03435 family protein [Bryobacteraceae bacterium]
MAHRFTPRIGFLLALAAASAWAQPPAGKLEFEVASIKIAVPPNPADVMAGKLHIGMKVDGARVDIGFMSLADLIRTAYKIKPYQLAGPDWMGAQRFDILAKMPAGSNKDQVPEMLQALLADRFKLAVHRDSKEHAVYDLVVAKGGVKLRESPPDPDAPKTNPDAKPGEPAAGSSDNQSPQIKVSGNTIVVKGGMGGAMGDSSGGATKMTMNGGSMHMEASGVTMARLADMLSGFLDRPVMDRTDLKARYDVALDLSMDDIRNAARAAGMGGGMMMGPAPGRGGGPADAASDPSSSSLWAAVQSFGLKLDARKEPLENIVVDHLEKAPTEN